MGRVAIATKDGIVVTEHFGHCSKYNIYNIDWNSYELVEQRWVTPPCYMGSHSREGIIKVVEILKDCNKVIVNQIGPGAAGLVNDYGLNVITHKGYVLEILEQLKEQGLNE